MVMVLGGSGTANGITSFSDNATFLGTLGITGALTQSSGAAFNLASGQLAFPATANESSDANTLDDYEQGTFTPVLSASDGAISSVTYSSLFGRYVKIGTLVKANFYYGVSAITSGRSGYAKFSLPFSPNISFNGIGAVRIEAATGISTFYMASIEDLGAQAACYIRINTNCTGSGADLSINHITSGTRIGGTYVYQID